jgi:hypothetical protein
LVVLVSVGSWGLGRGGVHSFRKRLPTKTRTSLGWSCSDKEKGFAPDAEKAEIE